MMKLVSLQKLVDKWIDAIEFHNPHVAQFLCQIIPARCPFEQEIKLFRYSLFRIPSLCKLNPIYEQLVSLRFKALSYLANECGEDVTRYC
ncbi:Mo-dependent nitrogenase C-terminal domain-containing protein [Nostoc linckia FACHB-104]|nr:Mo-dependent nitrogenase C-terminal domain-containing protein [Nostoc linckia FACHB-104]